jgi:hypothetical protein
MENGLMGNLMDTEHVLILWFPVETYEKFTRGIGKEEFLRGMERRCLLMDPAMKENGSMGKLMAKESRSSLMETLRKVNGSMETSEMEYTGSRVKEWSIKESSTINLMGMGSRHGLMDESTRESGSMGSQLGKESSITLMENLCMGNG